MKNEMDDILKNCPDQHTDFTAEELDDAIKLLKAGKASGLDGITTEMINHFGTQTRAWLLNLMNECATACNIPKSWRKARVVALLKPGKPPDSRKSYRPITLLSILYTLYSF